MKLIICLDSKNGQAFNHRRQTRDKKQRKHMYELIGENTLRISPYSYDLLKQEMEPDKLIASEDYLSVCGENEFAFSEVNDVSAYIDKADTVYVYRWDKYYLSDVRFDESLLTDYSLAKKEKLRGSSHGKITFEEYTKK